MLTIVIISNRKITSNLFIINILYVTYIIEKSDCFFRKIGVLVHVFLKVVGANLEKVIVQSFADLKEQVGVDPWALE